MKTKKVVMEERVNGTMLIRGRSGTLEYKEIIGRPERNCQPPVKRPQIRKSNIPSKDHPWRTRFKRQRHPLRDASAINPIGHFYFGLIRELFNLDSFFPSC